MSERELKICRRHSSRDEWVPLDDKPNSEAPSVAEVVEVLREAQEAMKWLRSGTDWSTSIRIDNLIARLEGA